MERIKQLEAVMDFVIEKYEKEDMVNITEQINENLLFIPRKTRLNQH